MRRVHSLANIKMQCLNAAAMRAVTEGDYETAERLYDECDEAEGHSEWSSYNLVNRLGQILPKIPVHALRRPCCKEHGIGIDHDRIEDMIYITWKDKTCDSESESPGKSLLEALTSSKETITINDDQSEPTSADSVFDFLKRKSQQKTEQNSEPKAGKEPDDAEDESQ